MKMLFILFGLLTWNGQTLKNLYLEFAMNNEIFIKLEISVVMLAQFRYKWLYQKLPFSISQHHGQIQRSMLYRSIDRIIENPILKIFSLFAKYYMIITTTMAPKLYTEPLISRETKYIKSEITFKTSTNLQDIIWLPSHTALYLPL